MSVEIIVSIVVLLASSALHELVHAYSATMEGDPTPKKQGRLTLNPIKHIDAIGSLIIPSLLVIFRTGFVFGWAKPVEFNPDKFDDKKWGPVFVGVSGPFLNLILALTGGLLLRFSGNLNINNPFWITVISTIVVINIVLFVFNIFPVTPLDGHYIYSIFGIKKPKFMKKYGRYFAGVAFALFLFLSYKFMGDVVTLLYRLVTGF